MKKVLSVFGTRPEAIKMAPLVKKLQKEDGLSSGVCVTAQHREMLDMALKLFNIEPDYDLDLMSHGQTITDITTGVIKEFGRILKSDKPDLVLVHGDTTTTFAASLAAFYSKIPVGHVEAGLRTGNIYSPYPEEMNRRLTSALATYHFAPTEGNRANLLKDGIGGEKIFITGNTVIDALKMVIEDDYSFPHELLNRLDFDNKKIILLTAHRRENWGEPMKQIFGAVKDILMDYPECEVVFPVHPNKIVGDLAFGMLGETPRVHLIAPLDYAPFANLMARSYLILSDSGGIQEEAPALGKPVLVLRTETERPEAVVAGTVKMAGVQRDDIYRLTAELLTDDREYKKMSRAVNPYGDGQASARIVSVIKNIL